MSKILDTAEKEVIRAEILGTCEMAGQGGADTKVLKAVLKKAGYDLDEETVKEQVHYLELKGLVSVRDITNKQLGIGRTLAAITALGIDYIEGNAPNIPGMGG
jgi:ribosomal protein L4